jgi:anti-anti-sigma factor
MAGQRLEFAQRDSPEETVLEVRGIISGDAVEEFDAEMERVLSGSGDKDVTVNLAGVEAINSAGLGKLLLYKKRSDQTGRQFRIRGCSKPLYDSLVAVRLDSVIDIER